MNGFVLLLPLLLTRYGLLCLLNRDALKRAAFFPPVQGRERVAFGLYQLSTVLIFVVLCVLQVKPHSAWFYCGLFVYGVGTLLFITATVNFAAPSKSGIHQNGLYRFSRNPMYIAYFIYFLGCVLLTQSVLLFLLLLVFQGSAHWIILSEERWCQKEFGEEYVQYAKNVRRYI